MSLELVNTFATFGTFLVIAGTAIAAIIQLRHARASNQIAALNELLETDDREQIQSARRFVVTQLPEKLRDPSFRHQLGLPSARTEENVRAMAEVMAVGNFYESLGLLVKTGLVDREVALGIWCVNVLDEWRRLETVTALFREKQSSAIWEHFEFLAVLAQDWLVAHPNGTYPVGMRRLELRYPWREADQQYAASLAPA